MGRDAVGVRGIRLREGDFVIGAVNASAGGMLLTVTENGYGKRTPIEEYVRGSDGTPQKRGGMGLKNYNVTAKTGPIAGIKVVRDTDDVLLLAEDGTLIRTGADTISVFSRATQGVRLMRVSEGARLLSVAATEKADESSGTPTDGEEETQTGDGNG